MPDKKEKKEVAYVGKSVGTDLDQRYANAKEMLGKDYKIGNKGGKGESELTINTAYNSMLPEFEVVAPSKMYGSPAKQTVDPATGNVIPDMSGTGPTNSMNDQTAATVQSQADQLAIKENRAGTPNNPASSAIQTPMTMKGNFKNSSIETAARMFGNVPNPVPSPQQFNSGLRKASADGKLKGNFEKAVNAAPATAKGDPPKKPSRKESPEYLQKVKDADNLVKLNRTLNNHLQGKSKIKIKLPEEKGVGGDPDEDFEWSESPGMYKAPGMHEKHTQISKANVNSAMKDNAAHISYLKRDINYDNKHGGSNKSMTSDEKHISKLAGDIKYDVKKKRKYDNV